MNRPTNPLQMHRGSVDDDRSNPSTILWMGGADRELGWLYRRIGQFCEQREAGLQVTHIEDLDDWDQANSLADGGLRRLVVASHNRWEYPWKGLKQFLRDYPEVPAALAMSDWWLGSRRTGMAYPLQPPHVCLHWFRWWDGWVDWLEGTASTMFGPFPSSIPFVSASIPAGHKQAQWLLVGSDWQCLTAWSKALGDSSCVQSYGAGALSDLRWPVGPEQTQPDWVLWDDTRLSTCQGWKANIRCAIDELTELRVKFPEASLVVAWTLPTWAVVESLSEAGFQFELLAKPFLGNFSSAALRRM
jgi:hypothetical protein